jgi:hypothetical protein
VHYKAHQEITYEFLRDQIQVQSDRCGIKDINDVIEEIQSVLRKTNLLYQYWNLRLTIYLTH